MKLRRTRIANCYFELLNSNLLNTYKDVNNLKVIDLRNVNDDYIKNLVLFIDNTIDNVTNHDSKGLLFKTVK